MGRAFAFVLGCLLVSGELSGQEKDAFSLIRKEVKASDELIKAISAKYQVVETVSRKVVEESGNSASCLSVRTTQLDGVWFGDRYSTKAVSNSTMGDGSKDEDTDIFAFSGKKTYQNQNFKHGVILPVRVPDNFPNPRLFAAPRHLAALGTLEQILNVKPANAPWSSAIKSWKNFRYRYLGEEDLDELKCHKIELSRLNPEPPEKTLQQYVIWVAPKRNWQIAASQHENLHPLAKGYGSKSRVSKWKEVKEGIWIPSKSETIDFGQNKAGERVEKSRVKYELLSIELKCDPKDKRFNDVGFLPSMEVQILDPINNTAKRLQIK